ncbi:MAG: HAD family phosphatase [Clostridia bacterium]|nr:HAD family phosphatase [Clostridia bacterium]
MGRFSGILLASDYDGTLADDHGQIVCRNRQALAGFIADGGLFTVCTGRTKQGFHAYDPRLMNAPVLLANGIMAYRYDLRQTVFCDGIPVPDARLVIGKLMQAFPDICIEAYTDAFESFAVRLNDRSKRHFEAQSIVWRDILSPQAIERPCVKIMLSCGRETGAAVQRFLDREIPREIKYIPSDGDFVELINVVSDKGKGLLKLASMLGVREENVFAIGDGENDLDMLRAVKTAFVPANGCEKAKAAAAVEVCSNNDGAIADAITWISTRY